MGGAELREREREREGWSFCCVRIGSTSPTSPDPSRRFFIYSLFFVVVVVILHKVEFLQCQFFTSVGSCYREEAEREIC